MPYPKVAGGFHIASSSITIASVIVGFPDQRCYGMVNEVLYTISLSHIPHPEPSSTFYFTGRFLNLDDLTPLHP